ncbi:hypothetical protein, partial [Flavobacterium sp.]|uniref:hypothetical protein n=1 Tax=Flavobacterium sp. TaxID=239 RepID=UPI0037C10F26
VTGYGKFLGYVASLNINLFCFSYKFFGIFVKEIVEVFSQSDVVRDYETKLPAKKTSKKIVSLKFEHKH